jgi:serine/threonine-protein kinase HipA
MRVLEVYRNGIFAGTLTEVNRRHYVFVYDDLYLADGTKPAVSLTLSKSLKKHQSEALFPCFSNLLSEGVNRKLQSQQLRIDEGDSFGLLAATAQSDTVGSLTFKPVQPV